MRSFSAGQLEVVPEAMTADSHAPFLATELIQCVWFLCPRTEAASLCSKGISKSGLKPCLVWFDCEQMGETLGPNGQVGLRRNPTDASGKFRLLMHGLLVARCAQIGEATIPAPTEISCSNPKSGRYFA